MGRPRQAAGRLAGGALALGICLALLPTDPAMAAPQGSVPDRRSVANEGGVVLDVPFVAQSPALCGGAAAAMVLRYWGAESVHAEDFAPLVDAVSSGIRVGDLVRGIENRGWTARAFAADRGAVERHLSRRRPLVALLHQESGDNHYVVIVATAADRVLVHDPSVGPYRSMSWTELAATWETTGWLALLIVPTQSPGTSHREAPAATHRRVAAAPAEPLAADTSRAFSPACEALTNEAVRSGSDGMLELAAARLREAMALCPGAARPVRELAAVRFAAARWSAAADLAERAVELDPTDEHAWRLLATSRFLADERQAALEAWNRIGEPRIDLLVTPGLRHVRYRAVAERLGLRRGDLLTPKALGVAERRLDELPAAASSAVRYRPSGSGLAQVDAAIVPRPRWDFRPGFLARVGVEAGIERQITAEITSPTGGGERLSLRWRWQGHRPLVQVTLATPDVGGLPGILTLEALWEAETRRLGFANVAPGVGDVPSMTLDRQIRRRGGATLADWLDDRTRFEIGLAMEKWSDRGLDVAVAGALERRVANDHGAIRLNAGRRFALGTGKGFTSFSLATTWRSTRAADDPALLARAGLAGVASAAPARLWPGAGTGTGRGVLLRAHALLDEGIIAGEVFGRYLAHGGIEGRVYPLAIGPIRLGVAAFADWAKVWEREHGRGPLPLQVDVGGGLRARLPGAPGHFRLDAATGLRGGSFTISVGWQSRWPDD